jgi:hypothetical protein
LSQDSRVGTRLAVRLRCTTCDGSRSRALAPQHRRELQPRSSRRAPATTSCVDGFERSRSVASRANRRMGGRFTGCSSSRPARSDGVAGRRRSLRRLGPPTASGGRWAETKQNVSRTTPGLGRWRSVGGWVSTRPAKPPNQIRRTPMRLLLEFGSAPALPSLRRNSPTPRMNESHSRP